MIEISFKLFDYSWKFANENSCFDRDILEGVMTIKNINKDTEDTLIVFINEFYYQLVEWVKNDLENAFKNFKYIDPIEFLDYFYIVKNEDKYYVYFPGVTMELSLNEVIELGKNMLSQIKDTFKRMGSDGVKYFDLLCNHYK